METLGSKRQFAYLLCSVLLSLALVACGGTGNSTNSSSSNVGSSSGATNPGSGSSGGTSQDAGGSGVTRSSNGSVYLYSSIYTDGGGVTAFAQNGTGTLTQVSGSPYIQQAAASMGALAAFNGYVYISNLGPLTSTHPELVYYRVDPATGALTQVDTVDAGVGTNGDSQMRSLLINPADNVMYGIFQYTVATYSLSSSGAPTFVSSTAPSSDSVWGFDFMQHGPYAYAAIQNGNPSSGFQVPEIHLLTIAADGSLHDSRTVATLSNASGMAGDLKVDPSGKFVVVSTGERNEQLSVYAIQSDGSLVEVPGSPFSTGAEQLRYMAFDSTGNFLYTVNQHEEEPQTESVQVFSMNQSTGALTSVQTLNQLNEQNVTWLKVDGNFVYLTNVVGGTHSVITTYTRAAKTGQLTQTSVTTVDKALGQTETLHE